eukprot:jgi/Botrbrau1/18080/Bobra.0062s0066.1
MDDACAKPNCTRHGHAIPVHLRSGSPKRQHLDITLTALDRQRHPTFLPDNSGCYDQRTQFYFKRTCGQHYALLTLKTVHVSGGKALGCNHCDGKVSSHEMNFARTIRGLQADMGFVPYTVTEARVVKGRVGAADFYFPDYRLAIQVDGEHHVRGNVRDETKKGSGVRDQVKRDEEWNAKCVEAGINLWRVHYLDASAPSCVLKALLLRAQANTDTPFIEFSRGYKSKVGL